MMKNEVSDKILASAKEHLLEKEIEAAMKNVAPILKSLVAEIITSDKFKRDLAHSIQLEMQNWLEDADLLGETLSNKEYDKLRKNAVLELLDKKKLK